MSIQKCVSVHVIKLDWANVQDCCVPNCSKELIQTLWGASRFDLELEVANWDQTPVLKLMLVILLKAPAPLGISSELWCRVSYPTTPHKLRAEFYCLCYRPSLLSGQTGAIFHTVLNYNFNLAP